MIDIKILRENPDKIKDALKKRGINFNVEELLILDKQKREIQQKLEQLRAQKNKISSSAIKNPEDLQEAKKIKSEIKILEDQFNKISLNFEKNFLFLPNIPLEEVPGGKNEKDNVIVSGWGKIPRFDFPPKDHAELGRIWDLIDIERGVKVSGARFAYLKNEAALLELALLRLVFDILLKENFIPIFPPVIIKQDLMRAMGYIDTKDDLEERYFLEKDNLFLVGTAEQSIGPMHKDEIFEAKDLPKRYLAFSTCFREEAGSYGKDIKGIFRVHQFDKLEMFSFVEPDQSKKEHFYLLGLAQKIMKLLEIPHRIVKLCAADISRPSAATYDIEAWIPSQGKYRETHSVSNCTDFQARRLNIKYKSGKGTEFVHTLNGTSIAIGRTIIAILENFQQKNGKILMPRALRKYLKFKFIPKNKKKQINCAVNLELEDGRKNHYC